MTTVWPSTQPSAWGFATQGYVSVPCGEEKHCDLFLHVKKRTQILSYKRKNYVKTYAMANDNFEFSLTKRLINFFVPKKILFA